MVDTWRPYAESIELLKSQWAIGPLPGHKGCGRSSWEERIRLPDHSREIDKVWHQVRSHRWCKSISCRPGDPFGCSMTKARTHRDRTELIVGGWLASGYAADLMLLEARGSVGRPLDLLLKDSAGGVRAAFEGKYRTAGGLVGKIHSLGVARTDDGEWIARHWLILCRGARSHDQQRTDDRISNRFSRGVEQASCSAALPISRGPETVRAVAQLVTECRSGLDPDSPAASDLDERFGVRGGQSPEQLAHLYRGEAAVLGAQFDSIGKGYDLERTGDRFEITHEDAGRQRWRTLLLPVTARPFVEYAVAMKQHPGSWNAYPVRSRDALSERWNDLIRHAQAVKASYMPYEASMSGRTAKKK